MQSNSARILLLIFALSVSITQLIEIGHNVLHTFENPIHFHKALKYKDFKDHSLADHHFPKMKFAYEMEEDQAPINNFIALAYGYFQSLREYRFTTNNNTPQHVTGWTENYFCPFLSPPPTPPPAA